MTTATVPTARVEAPRRPALDRRVAMRLAAGEYERFVAQLRELGPDDWSRPTVCSAWDVHDMVCHVLGMAEMAASPVEQMRQLRAAKRRGGLFIDALTGLQVEKHAQRSPAELLERLPKATRRAARGRARTPSLIRRLRMGDQPVDETGAQTEPWTVGYLTDVVLTRDTWVHRSDIALATGREMGLSGDHDGLLLADVVASPHSDGGEHLDRVLAERRPALPSDQPAEGGDRIGAGLQGAEDHCLTSRSSHEGTAAWSLPADVVPSSANADATNRLHAGDHLPRSNRMAKGTPPNVPVRFNDQDRAAERSQHALLARRQRHGEAGDSSRELVDDERVSHGLTTRRSGNSTATASWVWSVSQHSFRKRVTVASTSTGALFRRTDRRDRICAR